MEESFSKNNRINQAGIQKSISVIVITYNSSKTVIETLESVKNQTFQPLELIISDDGSKDNTIDVCKRWIDQNNARFINTKIITHENTGTAGNLNRGCRAATSEWVKFISGDDLLIEDGIERLYEFSLSHTDANVIMGKVLVFGEDKAYDNYVWEHNQKLYSILDTAEEQYWYLQRRNFIAGGGMLLKKSLWESVGGYDEEIPLLEDWPMWLKITGSGHKIYFCDDMVAMYRLSDTSVRSTNYLFLYNVKLFLYKWIYRRERTFNRLKKMTFLKRRSIISALVYKYLDYDGNKYRPLW